MWNIKVFLKQSVLYRLMRAQFQLSLILSHHFFFLHLLNQYPIARVFLFSCSLAVIHFFKIILSCSDHTISEWMMKGVQNKKEVSYYVKQTGPDEKQVILSAKYTINRENFLFQIAEFIVPMIDQKNTRIRSKYHDVFEISYYHTVQFTLSGSKMQQEKCMICLQEFVIREVDKQCYQDKDEDILMLGCSHKYHKHCLLMMIGEKHWAKCPICSTIFGHMTGDQPQGSMNVNIDKNMACQGHPKGTIIINYHFPSGKRNGKHYSGTSRVAYLPNTPEGNEVLDLLKEAFERKLTFTVGRSVTTGLDNQVVWNGIHHKTSISGGSSNFGYPDPTYLTRVKEELACKGIVSKRVKKQK